MITTDFGYFVFRVILFSLTTVLFAIAGKMTNTNFLYEDEYHEERPKRIKERYGIICCIFLLGLTSGAYAIYELYTDNPNEFLGMKIVFYLLCWSLVAVGFAVRDLPYWHSNRKIELVTHFLDNACIHIALVGGALFVVFFIYGAGIAPNFLPQTVVEREIVSSTDLVAANDGQKIDGELHSGLFTTTFTISENGVYRYYYRAENGGIKQGWVPADKTTIFNSKDGETPHLDKIVSYSYATRMLNNRPQDGAKRDEKYWYELYVPEGSVVEAYVFDLQ